MTDTDEVHAEFLIQHFPLSAVLAFVCARDEVRRIAAPLTERLEEPLPIPTTYPTLRAASGYVVELPEVA